MKLALNSIGMRFIALLILPLIIIFSALTFVSVNTLNKQILDTQKKQLENQVNDLTIILDSFFSHQMASVKLLSSTSDSIIP
ncbi:MAG: hypothetical protein PQJ46_05285, partial [Spirochaetales bacterium]|nr:hypothetical protein [Spirochaetales bacterium]